MKKIATIVSLAIFAFVSIVMPYGNFEDNYATRLLYSLQQKEDPDLNISEFIFEKLLYIGEIFEDGDEEEEEEAPVQYPLPIQTLQLQAGFLDCYKPVISLHELPKSPAKPTCLFKETKFGREFSSAVFHPPVFAA